MHSAVAAPSKAVFTGRSVRVSPAAPKVRSRADLGAWRVVRQIGQQDGLGPGAARVSLTRFRLFLQAARSTVVYAAADRPIW